MHSRPLLHYNDNSDSMGAGTGNRTAYAQGTAPYGKIAAYYANNIWTMNADGSGAKQLKYDPWGDYWPSWSSDGTKVAFIGPGAGVYYINADGSGETLVTPGVTPSQGNERPNWSRSGNDQILFDAQPALYLPTLVLNGITLCVGKEKSSPPIIVPASNRL